MTVLVMAAADIALPEAGPSRPRLRPLPYQLECSCPISLPSRRTSETTWPIIENTDEVATFVKQRYLETVLLPDILSPLSYLAADLLRIEGNAVGAIGPLLLSLSGIEHRYRKQLSPLVSAFLAVHTSKEVQDAKVKEAGEASGLPEMPAVIAAMALRLGSRAAMEAGRAMQARKVVEELERREILVQIVLLMVYLQHPLPRKKRKRDEISPQNQPKEMLELLFDRPSVWQAVAELGMETEGDGVSGMLKQFWTDVLLKYFPDSPLLKSFHLKVFGKPMEPTTTKKPRKPKTTRARPSSDHIEPIRPLSRAPSERSIPPEAANMRRSLSRTSEQERPRSRSTSFDHGSIARSESLHLPGPQRLARAPSGKDLFKGREVGFMRRPSGGTKQQQPSLSAQSQPIGRTGLLGRKVSDPKSRLEPQSVPPTNALVMATPSKPKIPSYMFGRIAPTPIAEETPGRIEETPRTDRVAETPGAAWEEDDYEDLMVMTDEEDAVPGTPG